MRTHLLASLALASICLPACAQVPPVPAKYRKDALAVAAYLDGAASARPATVPVIPATRPVVIMLPPVVQPVTRPVVPAPHTQPATIPATQPAPLFADWMEKFEGGKTYSLAADQLYLLGRQTHWRAANATLDGHGSHLSLTRTEKFPTDIDWRGNQSTIRGVYFHDGSVALRVSGYGQTVENCTFDKIANVALFTDAGGDDLTVRKCLFGGNIGSVVTYLTGTRLHMVDCEYAKYWGHEYQMRFEPDGRTHARPADCLIERTKFGPVHDGKQGVGVREGGDLWNRASLELIAAEPESPARDIALAAELARVPGPGDSDHPIVFRGCLSLAPHRIGQGSSLYVGRDAVVVYEDCTFPVPLVESMTPAERTRLGHGDPLPFVECKAGCKVTFIRCKFAGSPNQVGVSIDKMANVHLIDCSRIGPGRNIVGGYRTAGDEIGTKEEGK